MNGRRIAALGALDAFVHGGERRVDLAEVNGRVLVNNVSLGLYAEAVQRPGYREAKLRTLLDTVPEVLGPDGHGALRVRVARQHRAASPSASLPDGVAAAARALAQIAFSNRPTTKER